MVEEEAQLTLTCLGGRVNHENDLLEEMLT